MKIRMNSISSFTLTIIYYLIFILFYKYWWNTQDFSFHWRIISSLSAVKILFLSFTCEDIGVAMVTNMISQLQESFPLRHAAGSFEISSV